MTGGIISAGKPAPGTWRPLKVGAGGYMTGIDISSDYSTIVCRSDVAGPWRWDSTINKWTPLITSSSFASIITLGMNLNGSVEIVVAPSRPSRMFLNLDGGYVFKTEDYGATWGGPDPVLLYTATGETSNDTTGGRTMGQKIAIDPNNPDVVYCGTPQSGCYFSSDGGDNWSLISTSDIPACATQFGSGTYPGHRGICFDRTSTTTVGGQTRSANVYVPSYGNGVYASTDGGQTWALTSSGPTKVCHGKVAADGVYYVANIHATSFYWKYSGGSWTDISTGSIGSANQVNTIICDPADATRVICCNNGGNMRLSTDRGANWGSTITKSRSSAGIPWHGWTQESFMSLGDVVFDGSGNLWFAEGISVWTTPFSGSPTSLTWTSKGQGIENITPTHVIAPPLPNDNIFACGWDRSAFKLTNPEAYPAIHSPDAAVSIRMCWHMDYASSDPTFLAYSSFYAASANQWGFYSTDSGDTWTVFPGAPSGGTITVSPNKQGGCIACATPLNMIIVPFNKAFPWYTKDGGTTWTEIVLPDIPTSGETGFGASYYDTGIFVAADRVDIGTFYLFNYRRTSDGKSPSFTGFQQLFRSTDGGDNWTVMNAANIDTQTTTDVNCKLVAVPGYAGHLFFAAGFTGGANPGPTALYFSKDAGATWTSLGATIKEPSCVAVGKAAPAASYPAVYFGGFKSSVFGIWRAPDFDPDNPAAATWSNLGTYPGGELGYPSSLGASQVEYGEIYLALGTGHGFVYRTAD